MTGRSTLAIRNGGPAGAEKATMSGTADAMAGPDVIIFVINIDRVQVKEFEYHMCANIHQYIVRIRDFGSIPFI